MKFLAAAILTTNKMFTVLKLDNILFIIRTILELF